MRKILTVLLLLAFLSPAPALTAGYTAEGGCSLKDKSCKKHEKSCPVESHGVSSKTSHHSMKDAKAGKKGLPSFRCGCTGHDAGDFTMTQVEPFITGPLALPCDTSTHPYIERVFLVTSNPFIPIRAKPPTS